MKYQTQLDAIKAAQKMGSSAKTYRGARAYLIQHVGPITGFWPSYWDKRDTPRKEYYLERRAARIAEALGLRTRDVQLDIERKRRVNFGNKVRKIVSCNSYRVSEASWAGGDHTTSVEIGEPFCDGYAEKKWSYNGKWSGNNSFHMFRVKRNWMRRVYNEGLATIGGLVTLDAKKIAPREYEATWVEQGRGFSLKSVHGYIIRGYHVQTNNIEKARKKASAARHKSVLALQRARHENINLRKKFISVDDSIAAGNCRVGTEQFARDLWRKLGFGPCAIRADIIIAERDDVFTRRAIAAEH